MTSEIPEEFAEPFAKAKSLYYKDSVDEAGAILSDLLRDMVPHHGALGGPCARVYHLYGLCLLASARKEAPLLAAEQLEQLTSAIDDPGTAAGSSASTAAASSSTPTAKQQQGTASQSASASKDASVDHGNDHDDDGGGDDDGGDDDDGDDDDDSMGADQQQQQQGKEDDASLVQVGWECLECARLIFSRLPDSEDSRTRQADLHFELGSLYLETEQFPAAAAELEQCVDLGRKWRPDSRELAQALCQYGVVQKQLKDTAKARELFEEARNVVSKLIEQVATQTDARSKRALRTLQVIRDEVTSYKQQMENPGKGTAVSKVESMTNSFDAPTVTSPTTHVAQVKSRKKPKKKSQSRQGSGEAASSSSQPAKKAKTTSK